MAVKGKGIICGVGINDADYVVQKYESYVENGKKRRKLVWVCPFYHIWSHMIKRCYGYTKRVNTTYDLCYVCDSWLRFSNFKAWMEQQYWQGNELDKDIIVQGNKCYSPSTCAFVPYQINIVFSSSSSYRGDQPIGVYKRGEGRYKAGVCKDNELIYLGQYATPELAHKAWQLAKADVVDSLIVQYLEDQKYDSKVRKALTTFADSLRLMAEQGIEYKG